MLVPKKDEIKCFIFDPNLYEVIQDDPTKELHKDLVNLWIEGKNKNLVSATTASKVMGISNNESKAGTGPTNRLSTLPHFRPGNSYFYPTLKIHKVPVEQLVPGVEPPCRLITALQDGVSKRSDVYLADRYLRLLERDFCKDLLIDTNDTLWWLEVVNNTLDHNQKKKLRPFTFDYKALYDSLSPELVCEALEVAMTEERDQWSADKKKWILSLVKLSLRSAVGQYGNNFYRQKKGVPTGGSLCVQLANIAVFYVMRKFVYEDQALMNKVPCLKRYIDDGAGFFEGTKRQFSEFISAVNQRIGSLGLNIDEHSIEDPGKYVAFLDIQYTFDSDGSLQTDLFVKPTDSRSYLQYGSTHPNHVFSAIVFSQCLRLRRIINNDDRLAKRLSELQEAFFNSNYPKKMVQKIITKVSAMPRSLKDRHNRSNASTMSPTPATHKTARVITTFGSDSDLVKIVEKFEPNLASSPSLRALAIPEDSTEKSRIISFVKRTGASIRNKLVKSKQLALKTGESGTKPCERKNCMTCSAISPNKIHVINNRNIRPRPGTCTTYNVVYALHCTACDKYYIGRTVRKLGDRFGEHRRKFYQLIKNPDTDVTQEDDEFSPGVHLLECHSACTPEAFNELYRVFIVDVCSPQNLEVREHKFIHELKTLKPFGINSVSPFGLPVLNF